jgi:H/ACA ribonucleoprotein complex subunit 4
MGEALLTGANMSELRRIRSGNFDEEDSCTLQDLVDAMFYFREEGNEVELRRLVRPVEDFVADFPKIWVRDTAVEALCNGADLALPGVVKCHGAVESGGEVAVMTLKDELVGIGKSRMSASEIFEGESGIAAELSRIVMERGVYPRYWK